MTHQVSWREVLARVVEGRDLEPDVLRGAIDALLSGEATSAQIAGLLVGLRAKGETPQELAVMLERVRAASVPVVLPDTVRRAAVDIVGTGGDGASSINISTMAALVTAAAGARVVKHGNRAASSATGSADVLEALGVSIEMSAADVASCVSTIGIAFCFAPAFHPALRFAGPTRRELGVPTVFNIAGPLANPASPEAMLVGCARAESAPVMAGVLADRGTRAVVVRGDDGLDEISLCATTQVWDATAGDVRMERIDPREWGFEFVEARLLQGASPERNVELLRATLDPSVDADHDAAKVAAIRDAVTINAAAALTAFDAAVGDGGSGPVSDRIAANVPRARSIVDSGAAWSLLETWVDFSSRLGAR